MSFPCLSLESPLRCFESVFGKPSGRRQARVDTSHGNGDSPQPLCKFRILGLRGSFGLTCHTPDAAESDGPVVASGLHSSRRCKQRRPCALVSTVEEQADDRPRPLGFFNVTAHTEIYTLCL